MFGEMLVVGGLAAVLVGMRQRVGMTADEVREVRAEAAIREALRGPEAAGVQAEFRRRGVQPPERRLNAIPFGWR